MRHQLPAKIGKGRSIPLSPELLVNMYAEKAPDSAKSSFVVHGTPGFTLFSTIDSGKANIRGLYRTLNGGALYCVVDQTLYSVSSAGTASSLGTIGSSGRVYFAESPSEIVIVAGPNGYTYNATEGLELITDDDFPGATSVTYQDGYFIFTNRQNAQKDQFFISSLLDGEMYDALDFATAENYPDNLVRVFADHSELLLFGTDSIEIWFNSGAADFPFAPSQGSIIDDGLGAIDSVQKLDESVVWLNHEGIVRRLEGNVPVRISDHAIEYLISLGDWENAYSYAYTQEGHQFYVLTIPAANTAQKAITVVYDAATRLWHQRKSYELDYSRVGFYARAFGKHIVGDVLTGKLYELSLDTYQENGDHLIAEMHFPQIQNDGDRFIVHKFQLDMEVGHKLTRVTTQETSNATVIAVGKNESFYSTDGETFTQSDLANITPQYRCVATNNDADNPIALIMDSDFNIYRSTDGDSWTQIQSDITGGIGGNTTYSGPGSTGREEINGQFVYNTSSDRWLIVLDTGFAYSDDDGDSWTFEEWSTNHSSAFEQRWYSVEWVAYLSLYVACAPNVSGLNQIMYSSVGTSWTLASDSDSGRNLWTKVVELTNENRVLIGGADASENANSTVIRSADALTWAKVLDTNFPGVVFTMGAYSPALSRAVFAGAIGEGFYTDDAGDSWSSQLDFFPSVEPRDMIYSSVYDKFYAATSTGIYESTTGIETPWPAVSGTSGNLFGIGELDISEEQVDTTFDPQVMLRESSDTRTTGMTEPTRSAGKIGEYSKRLIWNRRGQHRSYTPIVRIADPIKRAVFASYVEIEPCER